jgi:protein ImuB
MKRILAIWLPNWPVQRLLADQPEPQGRAVVLYEQDARYGDRVKACSAAAIALGIRPTMPLAEAQALISVGAAGRSETDHVPADRDGGKNCPPRCATELARHDAQRDREALARLAHWCERFSPIVGLDQTDEPDCLLLDVSGLAVLFGGEAALVHQVIAAFQTLGLEVRVAVADTVPAAWAFARFAPLPTRSANVGVPRSVDAAAVRIIAPGDTNAWHSLPIESLRLPERTTERLRRLGIFQLAQLPRLLRAALSRRFGSELVASLDRLTGAAAEVIVAHQTPDTPAAHRVLEPPTTHRETLACVLGELFQRVAQQLREQGRGAWRLDCRLVCLERRTCLLRVSLYRPTADARHWLALARMQLETLALPDAVEEVQVVAEATAPCERRQGELFAAAARDDPAQLALLIERLSSRLGRERVSRPYLQAEAQVELAYRCVPLTGGELSPSENRLIAPAQSLGPLCRPLWICDPPEPIEVVGLAGDGPPALFHYRQPHRVVRCFGPERIETGWWRGESSRRDYYRVETESGQRLWLFRRLQDQRWFLHGEFG